MKAPVELSQLVKDDGPRRHIDAECECLCREDYLDEPARKELLNDLFQGRKHAGMVKGYTPLEEGHKRQSALLRG